MDRLDDFEHYDYMLYEPLADLGWEVEEVSWRKKQVDWNQFEAVIIRTPWDYQKDPEQFMRVLQVIDRSTARLENALELIEWNINKTYLQDLQNRGIRIVPTEWGAHKDQVSKDRLLAYFNHFETDEIVIKPTISAGADDTYRLTKEEAINKIDELKSVFKTRSFMVQPLMNYVLDEGEFSLIYFGEQYSHTLLKTPKQSDFRVQEEHGGILKTVEPEKQLLSTAEQVLSTLTPLPLYSRVDSVRDESGGFSLMELELIEPSLYFNMDDESPARFARFFDEWMKIHH
ncbi:MAG: hypothetical protein U5K69_21070 [Balneolaceae bacterium]|nr:hypothetical protein [Balneolaceae bacterium]